jgi:tRNA 2-thiouridine synthesizing protein C
MRKRFLIVNRRAPHGTVYPLEALDVVLAAAAFEQDVSLAFLDDGVCQLLKQQRTEGIGARNFAAGYGALGDYGIRHIYVERESLEARGLTADDLLVPTTVVARPQLADLMEAHEIILSF